MSDHAPAHAPAVRGPAAVAHRFRLNAFGKERAYCLEPDALVYDEGGKQHRIPYADIRSAHVYSTPRFRGQVLRRTILRGAFPGKHIIAAAHFAGVGSQEDRSESYFPFVDALLKRIEAANPDLTIYAGQPLALFVFWVFMLLVFIAMAPLMIAIMFDAGGFNAAALGPLAVLVFVLPAAFRSAFAGPRRRMSADALYDTDLAGDGNPGRQLRPPPPPGTAP
jgi:hypothetical protein